MSMLSSWVSLEPCRHPWSRQTTLLSCRRLSSLLRVASRIRDLNLIHAWFNLFQSWPAIRAFLPNSIMRIIQLLTATVMTDFHLAEFCHSAHTRQHTLWICLSANTRAERGRKAQSCFLSWHVTWMFRAPLGLTMMTMSPLIVDRCCNWLSKVMKNFPPARLFPETSSNACLSRAKAKGTDHYYTTAAATTCLTQHGVYGHGHIHAPLGCLAKK